MVNQTYLRWFTIFTLICTITNLCESKRRGCAAPQDLPDKPFFVVWNHATGNCEKLGIDLNLAKWGIVDNVNDKIVIFHGLGHWPTVSNGSHYIANGGVPQLGDLSFHLLKAQNDMKTRIPNITFNGLAVIDFEAWRPIFYTNWDGKKIYQQISLEIAHAKFPSYNKSQVLQEATMEFESAARSFLGKTLQQGMSLRPGGKWGYYEYPYCWDPNCNTTTIKINDQLSWLFKTTTAFYPSIYFFRNTDPKVQAARTEKIIHETLRVKAKWSSPDVPVFPYSQCQNGSQWFYPPIYLQSAIREPGDMGASGVVLWGASSWRSKNECLLLRQYINSTLGPFSLNVTYFFSNCTQKLCSGHGRCVRKDYEAVYQYHLRQSGQTDCLIPEEQLVRKRKEQKLHSHTNKSSDMKTKIKNIEMLKSVSEKSLPVSKQKLSTFEDILERFKRESEVGRNWDKYDVGNTLRFRNGDMENKGSFFGDGLRDFSAQTMTENEGSVEDFGNRGYTSEGKIDSQFPSDGHSDNPDELSVSDFDDYVCRCYAGWSGTHCEVKDEE